MRVCNEYYDNPWTLKDIINVLKNSSDETIAEAITLNKEEWLECLEAIYNGEEVQMR